MDIRIVPIAQITPASYNPRQNLQPGDPEYEQIKASLDRWGLVLPLVWNQRSGNLVAGHQRLKLLLAHGATEVECSVVDLAPVDERAMNVALNKLGGDWDGPALADLLTQIQNTPDLPFDVGITGFDAAGIEALLRELSLPMFEPVTQPEIHEHVVTDAEVLRTQERLDGRFTEPATVTEVVCPHCGQGFAIS